MKKHPLKNQGVLLINTAIDNLRLTYCFLFAMIKLLNGI